MKPIKVFISSVQSEFASERAALCDYIRGDALLGKFFQSFIKFTRIFLGKYLRAF
jgi:hypothetical protein